MDNFDRVCWGIKHSDSAKPESQSESVRHLILDKFSTIYPNARLAISKTQTGYPVLNVNEEEMDIPISFSHHGSFVAYAFNYNYP